MQTKWIYRVMTRILGVSLLLVMVINVPSTSMQGLDKVEAAVPMTMSNTGNSSKGLSESTNNTDIQPASITTVSGIVYDAGVEGLDNHGYPSMPPSTFLQLVLIRPFTAIDYRRIFN